MSMIMALSIIIVRKSLCSAERTVYNLILCANRMVSNVISGSVIAFNLADPEDRSSGEFH